MSQNCGKTEIAGHLCLENKVITNKTVPIWLFEQQKCIWWDFTPSHDLRKRKYQLYNYLLK